MGKKKVFAYIFLTLVAGFLVLFLLDTLIPSLSETAGAGWLFLHNSFAAITNAFTFVFYYNLSNFFIAILLTTFVSASIYAISYNLTKKHRLGGSISCIGCAITWLIAFELTIIWGLFAMLLNPGWNIEWKLIFLVGYIPILFLFLFILSLLGDVFTFWIDILKESSEYPRLRYRVETNGRIKVIHFDMSQTKINSAFSAACYILIEEVLRKEGDSHAVSRFIRSAITNIIYEFASHFNIWARFKNILFRFVGLKIGRDVLVAQYTRVDGLLPNLIILEDHTALGVSCNLITHTFIDRGEVRAFLYGPIRICKYARVGANVTITPGITIGEGAVVAAGSLVNKDVAPYTMVGGVPAKPIKEIDPATYHERIEKDTSSSPKQIEKDTSLSPKQIEKDTSSSPKQIEKDTGSSPK